MKNSKYVCGYYQATASEDGFNKIIALKDKIQCVAGLDQNDMQITEEDIEYCEKLINEVTLTLNSWFEHKRDSLVYLGKNLK